MIQVHFIQTGGAALAKARQDVLRTVLYRAGMHEKGFGILDCNGVFLFHAHGDALRVRELEMDAMAFYHMREEHQYDFLRQADILNPFPGKGDLRRTDFAPITKECIYILGKGDIGRICIQPMAAGKRKQGGAADTVFTRLIAQAYEQAATFPVTQGSFYLAFSKRKLLRKGSRAAVGSGRL